MLARGRPTVLLRNYLIKLLCFFLHSATDGVCDMVLQHCFGVHPLYLHPFSVTAYDDCRDLCVFVCVLRARLLVSPVVCKYIAVIDLVYNIYIVSF